MPSTVLGDAVGPDSACWPFRPDRVALATSVETAKASAKARMGTEGATSGADADRIWSSLMAAAQGGDRAAYATLLRSCAPLIRAVVRRTGVEAHRADDVVQDVLITIHRARQTYDPGRSFTAWVSVIAQRRAIDALRQHGRRDRREVFAPEPYEAFADQGATPEQAWEGEARVQAIERAVADLPPGQREAVESLAFRQLSLAEAAVATGKTTGALKVNLHRAFKTLRARFGDGR